MSVYLNLGLQIGDLGRAGLGSSGHVRFTLCLAVGW